MHEEGQKYCVDSFISFYICDIKKYWNCAKLLAANSNRVVGALFKVQVEVESMDKGGNFIGWLYVDGVNLSVALVEEGLAKVHFTAERSVHYKTLQQVEAKAKEKKLNVSLVVLPFSFQTEDVDCKKISCLINLWSLN